MLSSDGEAVIALPMKADVDCAVARREVLIATFTRRGQTRLVDNSVVEREQLYLATCSDTVLQ